MSDSKCYPKADLFRKPNFPNFPNCGFNTRYDNREVTVIGQLLNFLKEEWVRIFVRILTECSKVWIEHTT